MFENIKDIILIVLVIAVLYLVFKTTFSPTSSESFDAASVFAESLNSSIKNAVNEKYMTDIDAMRNLADISRKILNPNTSGDTLDLPATNTKIRNLTVTGDIKFTNKETSILEIFPRYMVISWAKAQDVTYPIPKGWAMCDGRTYVLDISNIAVVSSSDSAIKTPDLRGRFILGAGIGNVYENGVVKKINNTDVKLAERTFNEYGGEEKVALSTDEMPRHNHHMFAKNGSQLSDGNSELTNAPADVYVSAANASGNSNSYFLKYKTDLPTFVGKTEDIGGLFKTGSTTEYETKPHNNMPPFTVLIYIMKL